MQLVTVNLTDVEAGLNNRKKFDPAHIANLAKDKIYLKSPPTYRPHPTQPGKYQIIKGECRTRAARLNHETEIAVFIENTDTRSARIGMYQENHNRQDTTPLEDAKFFHEYAVEWSLLDDNGDPLISKVAEDLGAKRDFVASRLLLLRLNAKFQDAVDDKLITLRLAEILARLDKVRQDLCYKAWSILKDEDRTADELERIANKYKREEEEEIARLSQSDMFGGMDLSAPVQLSALEWRQQFGVTLEPKKTHAQEIAELKQELTAKDEQIAKAKVILQKVRPVVDENKKLKAQLAAMNNLLLEWKAQSQVVPIGTEVQPTP